MLSQSWIAQAIPGPWQSWTPTWANLTVGNGTTDYKYIKIGKTVFVRFSVTFGSTSAMGTDPNLTLPVTAVTYPSLSQIGFITMQDVSASTWFLGAVVWSTTTAARLQTCDASATVSRLGGISSTSPMTWTTSDVFSGEFVYEAA